MRNFKNAKVISIEKAKELGITTEGKSIDKISQEIKDKAPTVKISGKSVKGF